MPRLLSMLTEMEEAQSLKDLMELLMMVGYPESEVRRAAADLARCYLMRSSQGHLPKNFVNGERLPDPYFVRITSAGRYYLERLIKEFAYIEHMAIVTPLEAPFLEQVVLWTPEDLLGGVKSAAALLGQIHSDEKHEREMYTNRPGANEIARMFGYGRLAFEMGQGCTHALGNIRAARKRAGRHDPDDWDQIFAIIKNGPWSKPVSVPE